MPVDPLDRPIETLREETIDQLTLNYSHGELSHEAFERRLDLALDAETNEALIELTADLDLEVDSSFREQKKREFNFMSDSRSEISKDKIVSIFGHSSRQGIWDAAEEIKTITVFGDTDLDFSDAKFMSMTTRVNVSCVFGSVKIFIPEGVNVISKVSCILGDMKDKSISGYRSNEPTIVVEGFVLLGDIKVRLKKTFREKLLNFAETVKSVLAKG